MKRSVLFVVGIGLVSILFCPMVMAAPGMPDRLQMVQPDPSLPKDLSAFWGKWEGGSAGQDYFLIVEKIDGEKANVYLWRSGWGDAPSGWLTYEAAVIKDRGKYKLWFLDRFGKFELTLKGEYLDLGAGRPRLRRVQ